MFLGYLMTQRVVLAKGDSMIPAICSGDLILYREREEISMGDIVVFETPFKELWCHRVIGFDDGLPITKGDNNPGPDQFLQRGLKIRPIGKVILAIPSIVLIIFFVLNLIFIPIIILKDRRIDGQRCPLH